MDSMEGSLSYCVDEEADETTGGAVWLPLGYVTAFSFSKNKNKRVIYNKTEKVCSKKGRLDYSGNMSQLYTTDAEGCIKLFNDDKPVALKFEVDADLTGNVTETRYFSNVDFDNAQADYGNPNEGGDVTISVDFTYTNDHVV